MKEKPKKILIATGIFPPSIGGPATYAKILLDELPKRGIEVVVYSFDDVRRYPKVLRHIVYFFGVLKRSVGMDLIYALDPVSVGLPTVIASKILCKKLMLRVSGDYAWEQSTQRFGVKENIDDFQIKKYSSFVETLRSVQKFVASCASIVVTPSIYFRDLVRGWVEEKEKVVTIYNGIDFSEIPNQKVEFEKNTLVSAGRLVPWKRFDSLIENMVLLPDWKLFIVGNGPDFDRLRSIVSERHLSDRVFFLGSLNRKDLMEKIRTSEIFCLLTEFESFSFQIVEAMALRTPVISTNVGNIKEIITDGVDGVLIDPNQKDAFKNAVQALSTDMSFRQKIVEQAVKKAKTFDNQIMVDNFLKLL